MKFGKYITEMTFGTTADYEKLARYYVGSFGKEAKKQYMKGKHKFGSKKQEQEQQREVFAHIDKIWKKFGV